ncbi:MAG: hypothetical protein L0229_12275 [Blastocatellia bacterium]|nr:hypothetical protein [Blastocatellia bacterium]
MDWNGTPGIMIAGVTGLFIISLMSRIEHALLKRFENDTPLRLASLTDAEKGGRRDAANPLPASPVCLPVPDGEERLATQAERDDVNESIERSKSTPAERAVRL